MVTIYTINLPSLKEGAIVATTTQTHTKTSQRTKSTQRKSEPKKKSDNLQITKHMDSAILEARRPRLFNYESQ